MAPRKYRMGKRADSVAATRRRIVDATLELHHEQGIQATSWEEIAARAGVGVGTVYRHFRSLEELVPACGEVTFARLALPAPEELEAIFAGVRGRGERLRRLVEVVFAIYGRGAAEIENVRRERRDLPQLLEGSHQEIETALDGLVAEALRPFAPAAREHEVVRALTDVAVWRALTDRGITDVDAVRIVAEALASLR